jgi:capsular polysaccharide transport system permease protein
MTDTAEAIEPAAAEETVPAYAPVNPWRLQFRILKALILRDMNARWGDSRLGYAMGIIMPLLSIAILMAIFNLRGRLAPPDFPLPVFLITGYPVWNGFRGTYGSVLGTASRTDALLAFPQITQLDLIVATATLNAVTDTIVFSLCVFGVSFLFNAYPANIPGVMLLYWAAIWTGINLGLILCALNRVAPLVVTFINMALRLGMWVSGVVFTIDRLPPQIWPYLKWNPVLHIIEGLRHNWVAAYSPPIYDPAYIIAINFIMTMLGLAIERATRRHVGQ